MADYDRDPDSRTPMDAAKDFAASDMGKSVLKGAAVGAVACAILPFVGWGFGALVGGAYGAYRQSKKK